MIGNGVIGKRLDNGTIEYTSLDCYTPISLRLAKDPAATQKKAGEEVLKFWEEPKYSEIKALTSSCLGVKDSWNIANDLKEFGNVRADWCYLIHSPTEWYSVDKDGVKVPLSF